MSGHFFIKDSKKTHIFEISNLPAELTVYNYHILTMCYFYATGIPTIVNLDRPDVCYP